MAVMTKDCCRLFRYNSTTSVRTIVTTYLIMLNSYWVPTYFQLSFPFTMGTKLINFLSLHLIKPGEELENYWMLWSGTLCSLWSLVQGQLQTRGLQAHQSSVNFRSYVIRSEIQAGTLISPKNFLDPNWDKGVTVNVFTSRKWKEGSRPPVLQPLAIGH